MPPSNECDDHDFEDDGLGDTSPDLDLEHIRVFTPEEDDDEVDLDEVEDHPEKPALEDVLADLEAGKRLYADLYGFSDLGNDELRLLETRWPEIDVTLRASVVREAFDIGVEDIKLQFTRFFMFVVSDAEAGVRQLAVAALGNEQDARAAELLLDVLRDDTSDDVRSEAAKSLGPSVMLSEWEELPAELSSRLMDALFRVAENEDESWFVRRRAAESASAFGPSDRVNRLVQRMYDEDELGLRASALYAAGRGNQRAWLVVAIEELDNEDAEIRFEAARALGMFSDVDALPGLSELAKSDEDVDVRHAAIAAIGEIGGSGAIRILRRLYDAAPESDQDVIDDALIEASLETDPLSFGVDSGQN